MISIKRWCLLTPVLKFLLDKREKRRVKSNNLLVLLAALGGEEDSVDVGENTTLGDGNTSQELAQLLIVADSQLDVAGDDTGLLVVASGVASQLEDLSGEVLKDGSEVDGGTGTNAL